jgi:hypothetical protein
MSKMIAIWSADRGAGFHILDVLQEDPNVLSMHRTIEQTLLDDVYLSVLHFRTPITNNLAPKQAYVDSLSGRWEACASRA